MCSFKVKLATPYVGKIIGFCNISKIISLLCRKFKNKNFSIKKKGEQGWCSGESSRLPPVCPGFDSRTRRHMWAEFVGSVLCSERFFSGNSGFPLSSKTNI